nr:hypothetical protein B0A51_02225 [Rachicladosporium sp. CCFEE 5018]
MQADRRRLNAPAGGTAPPVFASANTSPPRRRRKADEHRKIFLQTGIVPSAAGSAYYELPPDPATPPLTRTSSLKITCTVHGPRPLPRNAAFSPNLLLTTHVKYAPFATKTRRGYVRDSSERDLGLHLETALRGVVIGERWPKSAADVVITVLEGEDDGPAGAHSGDMGSGWGMLSVLAGCITVASAAIVNAGIDCVDLVSGGVAALVHDQSSEITTVLDPAPAEHVTRAACLVAYLQSRDEITEMWMKGDVGGDLGGLIESAVQSATLARTVLVEAVKDSTEARVAAMSPPELPSTDAASKGRPKDVVMTG